MPSSIADPHHHPLDCPGGYTCHDECPLRHLDLQERANRTKSRRCQSTPAVVVTASRDMGRTASTWVFNAVRLLYRQAHEPCDSYWLRRLTRHDVAKRISAACGSHSNNPHEQHAAGAHVLIKTHEWTPHISRHEMEHLVRPLVTHVIVSVRQGFDLDPEWMRLATHVVHYEDVVDPNKVHTTLQNLAQHLGIGNLLSEEDIRQVDYYLMTMPVHQGRADPITKLWPFHSRRGGRPVPSNKEE